MNRPTTLRLARALWSAFVEGCGGRQLAPAIRAHVPGWGLPEDPPPARVAFVATGRARPAHRDAARWQGARP